MSRREQVAALRIALIIEEFNEAELRGAVLLLEAGSLLPVVLGDYFSSTLRRSPKSARPNRTPVHRGILAELAEADPPKHDVLVGFDRDLRETRVLTGSKELRDFGLRLASDFRPGKSRSDSITRIVRLLAMRPLDELEEFIESARRESNPPGTGYQRLFQAISRAGSDIPDAVQDSETADPR